MNKKPIAQDTKPKGDEKEEIPIEIVPDDSDTHGTDIPLPPIPKEILLDK